MSKKTLHNLKQCSAPEMNINSVTLDDEPQDEEDEEAEREQVEHVVSVAARQKPSDLRKYIHAIELLPTLFSFGFSLVEQMNCI